MPSSSARCSQLPRAIDKVPFYIALKKLRDHLRGHLPHLDESEVTFPDLELKVEPRKDRLERQLKQQQELAAKAQIDKKRRAECGDGNSGGDFDAMFSGMYAAAGYPAFAAHGMPNGMLHSAAAGGGWNRGAWPTMANMPTLGFQHPGSLVHMQRFSQVPTMDSMFSSVPLLLKQDADVAGGSSAAPQYSFQPSQFDPCSLSTVGSRVPAGWPSPHYSSGTFGNYPYGFQSLYGANIPPSSAAAAVVDGQYHSPRPGQSSSSLMASCSASLPYHENTAAAAAAAADLQSLASSYTGNIHAAYESSPFFLSPHNMSSAHHMTNPAAWPPSSHQYVSRIPYGAAGGENNPFNRMNESLANMDATANSFDPRG